MSVTLELLLHSPAFIKKLINEFHKNSPVESADILKTVLSTVLKGTKVSPNYLKQYLTKEEIIQYSRSHPKGYSINPAKLNDISRSDLKDQQYPILYYFEFIESLKQLFSNDKRIKTMKKLVDALNTLSLPPKWKAELIKRKLSDKDILEYSKSDPKGYYLNFEKLKQYEWKYSTHIQLKLDNKIIPPKKANRQVNTSNKVSDTSSSSYETKASSKSSTPSEVSTSKNQQKSTETTSASGIAETIQSFPSYLVDRMPKTARIALRMGVLEMNELDVKDLEKYCSALANARMFYDRNYKKEERILDHIDEKTRFMNERLEDLHNKEAEITIQREIVTRIKAGKYDKYIKTLGKSSSYDDVSYEISEKLGRIKKKIPLNDFALRKRLSKILMELYPENT